MSVSKEKYETATTQRSYSPSWNSLQKRWSEMRDELVKEVTQQGPHSSFISREKRGLTV